jgi:hypothetical protein
MKAHETTPLDQPAWDQFLAEAKTGIDRQTVALPARRSSRRRSVTGGLVVTAAAGLVLCVALVVDGGDPPGDRAVRTPLAPTTSTSAAPLVDTPEYTSASQVLTTAAVSSAAQTTDARDAKYWRVESWWQQDSDEPGQSGAGPRIFWQGHTTQGVLFQDGELTAMPRASFSLGQTSFTWDELLELTASPKDLEKMLRAETIGLRNDPEEYMISFIFELLAESPATPQLRSALWEVAAGLQGATLGGQVTDAVGRTGWSITVGRFTYVVDAETGNILETRDTGPDPDDGFLYRSTILSAGPSDTAPASVDEVTPPTAPVRP